MARKVLQDECRRAWTAHMEEHFVDLESTVPEKQDNPAIFLQSFFDGGTYYIEGRQSIVLDPSAKQPIDVDVLADDPGQHLLNLHHQLSHTVGWNWPDNVPALQSCQYNAAMCCWVQDRQANDNNGNCAEPYDVNCVNAKPSANTNLCYMDFGRAPFSNHHKDAFAVFSHHGHKNSNKAHCHGFAWTGHDQTETVAEELPLDGFYKANTLFHVSLYDHLTRRGYVKAVAGAPMCGCVERMPTVLRADCTEMALRQVRVACCSRR